MKFRNYLYITSILFILINPAFPGTGKIPVTTKSETALQNFLKGRELADKLRNQEAITYLEAAVEEDPEFALAHMNLALVQPSAKGFFESLAQAEKTAPQVSEGEQLWIKGLAAGVNGFPQEQLDFYQQLVELYPADERAFNLLGNFYFGQQEYELAIAQYETAVALAPEYSQPYNQLGYASRFLGDYSAAEAAFEKYMILIPDDPNPLDSYAELLMKMGKFEESIDYYKKALKLNADFINSHMGIAANYNYLGEYKKARKQLDKYMDMAHNDGERRTVYFCKSVSFVDEGKYEEAVKELGKSYKLAEKIKDSASMAADQMTIGNINLERGFPDEAMKNFSLAKGVMDQSNLAKEIKDNNRINYLFNAIQVVLANGKTKLAKQQAYVYLQQVQTLNNPLQTKQAHEL
ncbi:MAG: tetratricopeptide repeat protein, partial [FCB group bacterium]|nr:tetratricopeptide repeat protein [FCB group bacterium]